jgi:GLPGLI family protein
LPGLIVQLTENKTTYLASTIELNDIEISIDFPKGKTVSKEEYDKKLREQMGM